MNRDWRSPDDYEFVETLSPELLAWQFLRRNPEYQRDYQWFIDNWRALEADYGRAPHRDFSRWKLDERAYAPDEMTRGLCAEDKSCASPDGDRVLIECAMGAKWGFYKFPNDPGVEFPGVPEQLLWRELDTWLPDVASPEEPYQLNVYLDLRLPAKPQFDELKRLMTVSQKNYHEQHGWSRSRLRRYLRILDADDADQLRLVMCDNDGEACTRERQEAMSLRNRDYRLLAFALIR